MPGLSFSARSAIAFLLLGVAVAHAQQTYSQAGNKSSSYFAKVAASQPSRSESAQAGKTNRAPLRLLPRSENNRESHGGLARPAAPAFNQAAGTVVASLAIVLGLLFALVWGSRRFAPPGNTLVPKEAIELLGRAPLSGRQQAHLLRVGSKLLLVAVSPTGAQTLGEITDAAEVEHLTALCRRTQPGTSSAAFRQVLNQFASEPAPGGFIGNASRSRGGR
jgi:flagellar biogenesis protein FliO